MNTGTDVDVWVTTGDQASLLQHSSLGFSTAEQNPTITIDTATRYQTMDGFGYCLTGGSAQLINQKLNANDRATLLKELFLTAGNGIGISYLRVSLGASDLDDHVFSYDDLPAGQSDPDLKKFNLDADRTNLIPVLKEIIKLNPEIKIMASPWSAPVWMKTNNAVKGGKLKPEYYKVYAQYFVRYIQEMAKEGITIDAITVQNEPEHPGNTPSMTMTSSEQLDFVKSFLGPAFRNAQLKTKIVVYDHNCDHPDYPISILNDPKAKEFIDGSAFHLYLGEISAMSKVHEAHPDRSLYFTEQWTSGKGDFAGDLRWHVKNLVVGAPRNWSRNVLEWNLAADENFNPHTDDGGCNLCRGAITIDSKTGAVSRNVSYYIIAHASKFVPLGSVRVSSGIIGELHNVTYITPQGKKVLIVVNDNDSNKAFSVSYKYKMFKTELQTGAVGTYVW
ncbi:glucosylceramidase [Cytophagales bacterium WSM2-2]|nr:glucosylceramidase [Cytophagales bacterium WSM2-2]